MWNIDKRLISFLAVLLVVSFVAGVKYSDIKNKGQEILLTTSVEDQETRTDTGITDEGNIKETDIKDIDIKVYVCGEVKNPGVYELQEGSRLYEAIEMAGGTLEKAELRFLDMARVLQDEETIMVPAEGESPTENNAVAGSNTVSYSKMGKININTASAREMDDKLTGIGPTLAQRIVEYRSTQGAFKRIEDIKNVSGIGDKRFEDIKDSICVR